jgi:microcystin-dependent protein
MADVTISELTNRRPNSSAVFPYSEGGVTYNATLNQIIPTGVIMMWSGSIASVPDGWALCNGLNGTPNLTNRFIVGANVDNAGIANTDITGSNTQTGGAKDAVVVSHTHTISDPGHTHNNKNNSGQQNPPSATRMLVGSGGYTTGVPTDVSYTGITISSAGTSGTNANLPPYYALAYIMKL